MFSHIIQKVSTRALKWLNINLSWKIIKVRTTRVLLSLPKLVRISNIDVSILRCIVTLYVSWAADRLTAFYNESGKIWAISVSVWFLSYSKIRRPIEIALKSKYILC